MDFFDRFEWISIYGLLFFESPKSVNIARFPRVMNRFQNSNKPIFNSLVRDLKIILIFHPHYHTHSGNTSRPVNLAVVRWLVSNEDENEYGYDNGNEIAD